jgi:uncharacterized membrane protein YkvI
VSDFTHALRVYVVPGAVFQSALIGGGYGTGREIVEYFSRFGILGGALGFATVTLSYAILLGVSFEFARYFQAYDYRRFFRELLGKGWVAFEVLYLAMYALVLAVVAAASGQLFEEHLRMPGFIGIALLLMLVTVIAFYGRIWVTRVLAYKAVLLTVVFLTYFAVVAWGSRSQIVAEFGRQEIRPGWAVGALRYVLYSSSVIPAILFATRAIKTRREAYWSGVITAIIGIFPAVLMHASFAAGYPQVLDQALPAYWMVTALGISALTMAYIVVLFGSLLDCGLCFIQSVNERLDGWSLEQRGVPITPRVHAAVAIACVVAAGFLSLFGIVDLIARGYGTMAWGFLALFAGPLMTIGVHRLFREPTSKIAATPSSQ